MCHVKFDLIYFFLIIDIFKWPILYNNHILFYRVNTRFLLFLLIHISEPYRSEFIDFSGNPRKTETEKNLPANANCLIKKSIRVLRRLPHWRPIRTAILPTTIIANSSHKTVNCSVCNRKKKMEHNRDDSQVYRINLAT